MAPELGADRGHPWWSGRNLGRLWLMMIAVGGTGAGWIEYLGPPEGSPVMARSRPTPMRLAVADAPLPVTVPAERVRAALPVPPLPEPEASASEATPSLPPVLAAPELERPSTIANQVPVAPDAPAGADAAPGFAMQPVGGPDAVAVAPAVRELAIPAAVAAPLAPSPRALAPVVAPSAFALDAVWFGGLVPALSGVPHGLAAVPPMPFGPFAGLPSAPPPQMATLPQLGPQLVALPASPPLALPGPAPIAAPAAPPRAVPAVPPPAAEAMAPALVQILLRRGDDMMTQGDVSAARRLYERAAAAGNAQAATGVGRSFDPEVLAFLGAPTSMADRATALEWYRRGAALGDAEAARLLRDATPRDN